MAKGLSKGRITNIARSLTSLNVSSDFKKYLKERAEERIREITEMLMEMASEETKTIPDVNPHLSMNRVKKLMGECTGMRIGSSAAVRAKEEAEKLIKKLVVLGERRALENGTKTLMLRFMDEDDGVREGCITDDNLMKMIKCYTDKDIMADAVSELRLYLEEEAEEKVFTLEKRFRGASGKELKRLMR